MSDTVLRTDDDRVSVLTLNRPERLNAWTGELQTALYDHLADCSRDPDVRAIVITGSGRGFCAGADMDMLQDIGAAGGGSGGGGKIDRRQVVWVTGIPKPVIAAVNGPVAGIGLAVALACDLRFSAPGVKWTTAFSQRGLIAEHGMAWLLPRIVGSGNAFDLLFSGRVILAEEAERIGLVNRVINDPAQLVGEAVGYARSLADSASPWSIAQMKRQVYLGYQTTMDESDADMQTRMASSLKRNDFKEGVASFVERRPPQFEPVSAEPGSID